MAHQRKMSTTAADAAKEPHHISLKVLRLSRPTLSTQHPLPTPTTALSSSISAVASVSYPSATTTASASSFVISPLLTLPPAFGNAYVGETFSCTLCANNELDPTTPTANLTSNDPPPSPKRVTNVRIEAEMKTPSMNVPLTVTYASEHNTAADPGDPLTSASSPQLSSQAGEDLPAAHSLQGIITFHLREEGSHVLAVTVSYNESSTTSGRVRTFRKLYQFVARPCLVVRTKITSFSPARAKPASSSAAASAVAAQAPGNVQAGARWSLEAQLENVGEDPIVLTNVGLDTKPWCTATSLNWDHLPNGDGEGERLVTGGGENPILANADVQQVCFLVEQQGGTFAGEKLEVDVAGRLIMGILNIAWRGAMGNVGSLSTGWLGVKT